MNWSGAEVHNCTGKRKLHLRNKPLRIDWPATTRNEALRIIGKNSLFSIESKTSLHGKLDPSAGALPRVPWGRWHDVFATSSLLIEFGAKSYALRQQIPDINKTEDTRHDDYQNQQGKCRLPAILIIWGL